MTIPKSIAEEAQEIIAGARQQEYGDARQSFEAIAKVWSALLRQKLSSDLTAADVALLMTSLKLVRESNQPKRDNRVDAIGYLLLLEELLQPKPSVF